MTGVPPTVERVPTGPAEARARVHEILSVVIDALRTHTAPPHAAPHPAAPHRVSPHQAAPLRVSPHDAASGRSGQHDVGPDPDGPDADGSDGGARRDARAGVGTRRDAPAGVGSPGLELIEHRPRRDRASGTRYLGVRTIQHVSALIGSTAQPPASPGPSSLLRIADRALRGVGLVASEDSEVSGVRTRVWEGAAGDRAEVVVGARLLVRVISAPFLPGVEQGDLSTTPSAVRRVLRPARSLHAQSAASPVPAVAPVGIPVSASTPESPVLSAD
jgi:hypothetical protein